MPDFKIRQATIADAAAIAYVQYHGWQDTYRGIIKDTFLDEMGLEKGEDRWKKNLHSPLGFIDVMTNPQNEVIGFTGGGKSRNADLNCEAEIYSLYLLKKYHRHGLGKELFRHAVNHLCELDYKSFCLFVLKENATAGFYKKFNPDMENCVKVKIGDTEYDDLGLGWNDINKFLA